MLGTGRLGPEHDWLCKNVVLEHDFENQGGERGRGGGGRGRERERTAKSQAWEGLSVPLPIMLPCPLSLYRKLESECHAGDKKRHINFVA